MATFEELKRKLLYVKNADKDESRGHHPKITVVGVGQVGMACASSIAQKGIAREITLVDVVEDKLQGERMDLQQAASLLRPLCVKAGTDYAITKDSDICIITAGARQEEGETRIQLLEKNEKLFKKIVPALVKNSPNAILLVVSNPVDIMTWMTWKISGFPQYRVIGSGTTLDSARFRFLLGEKLGVSQRSIHGYVIGEHGDSAVAAWSTVTVGGAHLATLFPNVGEGKSEVSDIMQEVKKSAYEVIKLKGYTSWAIGICVSLLVEAILSDSEQIYPVSTSVNGSHGFTDNVFASLPCVLTRQGVREVIELPLRDSEKKKLQESITALHEQQQKIKFE